MGLSKWKRTYVSFSSPVVIKILSYLWLGVELLFRSWRMKWDWRRQFLTGFGLRGNRWTRNPCSCLSKWYGPFPWSSYRFLIPLDDFDRLVDGLRCTAISFLLRQSEELLMKLRSRSPSVPLCSSDLSYKADHYQRRSRGFPDKKLIARLVCLM